MIKFLSLFSGIGSPEQALKNIGVDYELVGFSEIDRFAVNSYCNIHDVAEELNLGDITKIDINSLSTDIDLITHGSPCTSFSIAGKQAGGDKGSGTPSSLMWSTVDIVEHCIPKVVVWENVKNLLSKKHRHNFDDYLEVMEQFGYNNYYQVLNAKDYGIPQNRERVFTVSIRKDIDKGYVFPEPQELTLRLKDMLEDEVDEKYYISTCGGGNLEPKIIEPIIVASRGRNPENPSDRRSGIPTKQRLEPNSRGIANTLTTVQKDNYVLEPLLTETAVDQYRLRKLTPRECWRLMGFTDEQFDKAAEICSNTQLYKQADNSIVVNVLEEIFKNLDILKR